MNAYLQSALAGFVATVPMTAWMLAAHRFMLPPEEQYPLPPERITGHVAQAAGLHGIATNNAERKAVSLFNHFAYGLLTGALYAPLVKLPFPPILKGIGLGSFIWSGSYLAFLPTLGILSPATQHPARRNALMIIAHFIWGGVTAVLVEGTTRRR